MAAVTGVEPIIRSCTSFRHIQQLQAYLVTTGLWRTSPSPRTKLVELCAVSPFGDLAHSISMFKSVHSRTTNDWNAVLRGLAQSDRPIQAVGLYSDMLRGGAPARPDALTCSFVFKACARVAAVLETSQLHAQARTLGVFADVILQTTLLDAYVKSGELDLAEKVFDEIPHKDIAAWNALICGFASGNRADDALAIFRKLRAADSSTRPNDVTVIGVLSACSQLGARGEGEAVHAYATDNGLGSDPRVRNVLIDMYAKCGAVDRAVEVFKDTPDKSLVTWNSLIMGLAMHGRGNEAVQFFNEMVTENRVKPDAVTYLAVLCGCNHTGLVEDGLRVFNSMREGVGAAAPNVKHYGTVVDLLGRAGRLAEAYEMVSSMPFEPDAVLWQTLLGACKTYGDVTMAEEVSARLAEMGSHGDGDYVLLSNVYASRRLWDDVGKVRDEMRLRDVRKVPGFSFIELGGVVHRFLNGGDGDHPRWGEIRAALQGVASRIRELGYVPETENILHDVGEEDKEDALLYHSEKVAMALGLISTERPAAIQVIKNLRICGDCHAVAKLVSRAYDRVIIIRDRARFHRFEGGICSCGDYW